jgi:multicomponent Na+:H+ antiporter subunit D
MNGVVLVNDIFTMYVFLEITAVSSFILIALEKKKESIEGAFKYFLLSAIATVLLLISISLIYFISSGTSFVAVNNALSANSGRYIHLAMIVFFVALFIKGGIVPFHGWLPDAYSTAPNSVSVLLAGIVTKVTGIYTIIRLCVSVFHADARINTLFLVLGAVSVVFGALSALTQTNFKRMLAYSSISQIGYIILGLGTGTILGMAGAVFHLFNHSVFKSLLFINSAAVEDRTGTENLNELGGLQAKMPVTSITSLIAFLSTAGIPPLSGFWSKLIIVVALWQSGNVVFAFIAVIASVITLAYFLNLQRYVFFGKLKEGLENVTEAKYEYVFPAVFLALITICAGVFFHNVINTIIFPFGFKL